MLLIIKRYLNFKCVLLFFSLIAAWPCVFYLMGFLPDYKINIILLSFLGLTYYLINQKHVCPLPKSLRIIISVQILTWILYAIIHFDTSYITRIVYIITTVIVLLVDNKGGRQLLIRIFVYWVTLQCLLSAIGFILCFLGLLEPISTFEEMDGRTGYNFGICTSNVYIGDLIRPSGFYDEPGALACWGIYALVINKLFIKKRIIEYVLLISLIATLSLAFFIQAFLYLILYYKKHIKKLLVLFAFLLLLILSLISQNPIIEDNTVGRLKYDKTEGTISGDNRSDLRKNAKKVFYLSPIIGVGATKLVTNYENINSNEYTFLACDGILGVFITLLPFFYLFKLGNKRIEIRYAVIILAVGLLQRPFDFNQLLFPLIVYSLIKVSLIQNERIQELVVKSQI